jgi:tRNA 5-methylaminomethyl-2-thiouridine biosynthesis bifunctional protein
MGEPAPAALALNDALVIEPHRLLAAWAPQVREAAVHALAPAADGWRLLDAGGGVLATADAVIVAAGLATGNLVAGLPLSAVRGQASWTALPDPPQAAAFGGYAIPAPGGVLFGATNDRGDAACDLRPDDHRRNLETLALGLPRLAARLAGRSLEGRASVRVATPDYLPVAGPAPDAPAGLFVLTGFGARGFTLAPLLAEHVAALALGAPSPLPAPLAAFVDPARFARRRTRRNS